DPYPLAIGIAVPRRNKARPLVIGIENPDSVSEHQPLLVAETGARQQECAPFRVSNANGKAGGDQYGGHLRHQQQRKLDARMQVEPRCQARSPGREAPSGEPWIEDVQFDFHERREAPKWRAIRSASRAATSRLVITGQSSIPSASTRWIVLRSPPKVPNPD